MPYKDPEKRRECYRKASRKFRAANPPYCARNSLLSQEWNMANRERRNEIARASYRRCKAAAQAEWNEIMAEIQGETDV